MCSSSNVRLTCGALFARRGPGYPSSPPERRHRERPLSGHPAPSSLGSRPRLGGDLGRRRSSAAPLLALLAASLPLSAAAEESWPWKAKAFSWSAKEGLAALGRLPKRAPAAERSARTPNPETSGDDAQDREESVDALLHETRIFLDPAGLQTVVSRRVFWVRTPSGASEAASVSASWRPWHQLRPVIRARVITPDGLEHPLDPRTLTTGSADRDEDDEMYTDDLRLTGPLPAIAEGALVEVETQTRDSAPFFAPGAFDQHFFATGWGAPRRAHLRVEAPTSVALRHKVHGKGVLAKQTVARGRTVIEAEAGQLQWPGEREPFAPPDPERVASLSYSTGESWAAVASGYARLVDAQIARSDVRAIARQWAPGASGRLAVARSLLAGLHKTLRYTGLELGAASITPVTPKEALTRKYGDCKDLSTLLVAALRASGLAAEVALVHPGGTVDPELPGLSQFNHAIVRMPGDPELWIDPSAPSAPVGELPALEQDLLALVAAKGSTGLVRTPASDMEQNQQVISREYTLAVRGLARVVEVSESSGSFAQAMRNLLRGSTAKELEQRFAASAKRVYRAREVGTIVLPPADSMDSPLRSTFEIKQSETGVTAEVDGIVGVGLSEMLDELPPILWRPAREPSDVAEAPTRARTADVALQPFSVEARYHILASPGLKAKLPEARGPIDLSPLRFTETYEEEPEGGVRVLLRLEVPVRRLTPQQLPGVQAGLEQLQRRELGVRFERTAWKLVAEGKVREAVAEIERYAAAQPKEAAWPALLGRLWLTLAARNAALIAARRAVEIDPASAYAWHTLAIAQLADPLGRAFHKGFDRDGGVSAALEAIKRDPKLKGAHLTLAAALMRSPDGTELGPGSRVLEAAEGLNRARKELKVKDLDALWIRALFEGGRYQAIVDAEPQLVRSEFLQPHLLAAHLLTGGAEDALQTARRLIPDEKARKERLKVVGGMLVQKRLFKEALSLLEKAPTEDEEVDLAPLLRQLVDPAGREASAPPASDAAGVALRALRILLLNPGEPARLLPYTTPALAEHYSRMFAEEARRRGGGGALDDAAAAQLLAVGLRASVESRDEAGFHVRYDVQPGKSSAAFMEARVVPTDAGLRLSAFAATPDLSGAEALAHLDAGRESAARKVLGWADASLQRLSSGREPALGDIGSASADELRAMSALLMMGGKRRALAEPVARALLERGKLKPELRERVALELVDVLLAEKAPDRAWAVLSSVLPKERLPLRTFQSAASVLRRQKRWEELRRLVAQRLKESPDDSAALRTSFWMLAEQGELKRAAALGRELLQKVKQEDERQGYENNVAWFELCLGQANADTLALAQRAAKGGERASASYVHTLAAVAAELGRLKEAREALLKIVGDKREIAPWEWQVAGRLYEAYGLSGDAIDAYRRAVTDEPADPTSSAFLARRRLEALEGRSAK